MRPEGLTLAETQSALFSLITGRETGVALTDPATFIVGDARASADERVAAYAFMYRARLAEALESQYPRLAKLLGGEAFSALCDAYVDAHPSTHWSLRFLGTRFASWLPERSSEGTQAGLPMNTSPTVSRARVGPTNPSLSPVVRKRASALSIFLPSMVFVSLRIVCEPVGSSTPSIEEGYSGLPM